MLISPVMNLLCILDRLPDQTKRSPLRKIVNLSLVAVPYISVLSVVIMLNIQFLCKWAIV